MPGTYRIPPPGWYRNSTYVQGSPARYIKSYSEFFKGYCTKYVQGSSVRHVQGSSTKYSLGSSTRFIMQFTANQQILLKLSVFGILHSKVVNKNQIKKSRFSFLINKRLFLRRTITFSVTVVFTERPLVD